MVRQLELVNVIVYSGVNQVENCNNIKREMCASDCVFPVSLITFLPLRDVSGHAWTLDTNKDIFSSYTSSSRNQRSGS